MGLAEKILEIRTSEPFLQIDNALPTPLLSQNLFCQKNFKLLFHPSCSPDWTLVIYFLSQKLKETLKERTFTKERQLNHSFNQIIKKLSTNDFSNVFQQWLERCKKCLVLSGGYFKGRR